MKSIIGITGNFDAGENNFCLREYYVHSVNKAGGTAIILPPVDDENVVDHYIRVCDGFIFSGGGDIDPVYWREITGKKAGEINPLRDRFELSLAAKVLALKRPALGICRGCQLLNVAAGGSLWQDIETPMCHDQKAPRDYPFHAILIEDGTRLEQIIPQNLIRVNSFHHQAVKLPGKNIRISAYAPDGTVEAIESTEGFIIGVQWHPECMSDEYSAYLFKALVDKASRI